MTTKHDEIKTKIEHNIALIKEAKCKINFDIDDMNSLTKVTVSLIDSLADDEAVIFYNQLENAYIHAHYDDVRNRDLVGRKHVNS